MPSTASGGGTPGRGDYDNRPPLDPYADDGASEFGWGEGLVPKGLEDAAPSLGGMYKGQSPPCENVVRVSRR